MIATNSFDLILMDIHMPVMDGIQAIKKIRAAGLNIPIITLSANTMAEDREKYSNIGSNGFIAKPIENDKFITEVSRFLMEPEPNNSRPDNISDVTNKLTIKFLNNIPIELAELEKFLKDDNWVEAGNVIHKLKGLGGSFGYPKITTLAQEVEKKLKINDYNEATKIISSLLDYCSGLENTKINR